MTDSDKAAISLCALKGVPHPVDAKDWYEAIGPFLKGQKKSYTLTEHEFAASVAKLLRLKLVHTLTVDRPYPVYIATEAQADVALEDIDDRRELTRLTEGYEEED